MKILYADTDPVSQVNFVNALKGNTSWKANYALSNEAVDIALSNDKYDLIIADLCFIDTVLNATESMSNIAVIAIGDVEDLSEVEYLFTKGVAQYLKKPFYGNIFKKISEEIESQSEEDLEPNAIIPDFEYLDRLTKGRMALKIDLMEIYLTVVQEELGNIAEGCSKKEIKKIGDSAHRMKSNVRMMGLNVLMEQLDQIEVCVRENKCGPEFYNQVRKTAALLLQTLEKVRNEVNASKAAA